MIGVERDEDGNLWIPSQRAGACNYSHLAHFIGWVCQFRYPRGEHIAVLNSVQNYFEDRCLVFRFADGMQFKVAYDELFELTGHR